MSSNPVHAMFPACDAAHGDGIGDRWLTTLVIVLWSSRALAVDSAATPPRPPLSQHFTGTALHLTPAVSAEESLVDLHAYSTTEFQPRSHAMSRTDAGNATGFGFDAPMLQSTTVWQQLKDYKSQDRLRLLTLWETRGSSLSLQTGKRGGPSLQWSTPLVSRAAASRGLFDRLVSSVAWRGTNSARAAPAHSSSPTPSPRLPTAVTAAVP